MSSELFNYELGRTMRYLGNGIEKIKDAYLRYKIDTSKIFLAYNYKNEATGERLNNKIYDIIHIETDDKVQKEDEKNSKFNFIILNNDKRFKERALQYICDSLGIVLGRQYLKRANIEIQDNTEKLLAQMVYFYFANKVAKHSNEENAKALLRVVSSSVRLPSIVMGNKIDNKKEWSAEALYLIACNISQGNTVDGKYDATNKFIKSMLSIESDFRAFMDDIKSPELPDDIEYAYNRILNSITKFVDIVNND